MQELKRAYVGHGLWILALGVFCSSVVNAAVDGAQCSDKFGAPGMISYWTFDDSGDPGKDDVSTNDGTLLNGALHVTAGQKVGTGAVSFDGGTGHIELDYSDFRKSSSDSFSFAAWFKADDPSPASGQFIFGVGAPCGPDNGTLLWTLVAADGAIAAQTGKFCQVNNSLPEAAIVAGQWYHTVGVFDSGNVLLYVDGILRSTEAYTVGATPQPSALIAAIGNNLGAPSARGFNGLIDEVAFFDRALTVDEVGDLHASTLAGGNYCESACIDEDGDGFGSIRAPIRFPSPLYLT